MSKNKGNKSKVKNSKVKNNVKNTEVVSFEERVSKSVGSIMSLYIHTAIFGFSFLLIILGVSAEIVLLTLTTLVSLEAIYLAIFIQMSVNKNTRSLEEVEDDLDEIQGDLDDIADDVEDIQEDIDDIEEEVEDIEEGDNKRDNEVNVKFKNIDEQLNLILQEIKNLKK